MKRKPKAIIRWRINFGSKKSVFFTDYEYKGKRYITGTVKRGSIKSLGWYFGQGEEGILTANRIALLSDEEFSKLEYDKKYSWKEFVKILTKEK